MTAYSVAEAKNTLPTAASHTRPYAKPTLIRHR